MDWSAPPVATPRRSKVMTNCADGEVIVHPEHSVADTVCETLTPASLMTQVEPLHAVEPLDRPTYQGEAGDTVIDTVLRLEVPAAECFIASERAKCAKFEIDRTWLINRCLSRYSCMFGNASAARMPSTAIVTISSINVNPR